MSVQQVSIAPTTMRTRPPRRAARRPTRSGRARSRSRSVSRRRPKKPARRRRVRKGVAVAGPRVVGTFGAGAVARELPGGAAAAIQATSVASAMAILDPPGAQERGLEVALPDGELSASKTCYTKTTLSLTSQLNSASGQYELLMATIRSPVDPIGYSGAFTLGVPALTYPAAPEYTAMSTTFADIRPVAQMLDLVCTTGPLANSGGTIMMVPARLADWTVLVLNPASSYAALAGSKEAIIGNLSELGRHWQMPVIPSNDTSGGEYEWRAPSSGGASQDQSVICYIRSAAAQTFLVTVTQVYQCHVLDANTNIVRPEMTVAENAAVAAVLMTALAKQPISDPSRVDKPAAAADNWWPDMKSVVGGLARFAGESYAAYQARSNKMFNVPDWGSSTAKTLITPAQRLARALVLLGAEEMAILRAILRTTLVDDVANITAQVFARYRDSEPLPEPRLREGHYFFIDQPTEEKCEYTPLPRPNLTVAVQRGQQADVTEEDYIVTPSRRAASDGGRAPNATPR